ncbi:Phenylacetate-coenzyme A ligase [Neorhodopirellula pilleata]|uniref:Phenylacetate-coenzyme A ligase n=2 Tax=Neorhodopirellula pilleata TaxID=2714738 RepID=A0A5C5ZGB4_9BACT|nr:Phenylacetate-coenzyme A ligase [Neorhodopirellula pilleata]
MPVLDTDADWAWWIECWQYVLDAAEVTASDVAMMAFSFGPFIGFWSANDALVHRGALVVPGGGLSTLARLKLLADQRCTVLCCTPTYALHMASVAKEHGINLADNRISRIIVAGEPGGSVPNVRAAIESQWNARVVDHAGASELGAWGFASEDDTGLHVIESEFITEVLVFQPDGTYVQAEPGQRGELVMTNLGRLGGPVMRYRTGDMVEPVWEHTFECRFVHLNGGVIGRADDMLVIRGVNVFPSSIESIVREIDPTAEFRMIASRQDEMDQLKIEIEADPSRFNAGELEERFRERLALRVPVSRVDVGTLPRSEGKSKRWVDERMDS